MRSLEGSWCESACALEEAWLTRGRHRAGGNNPVYSALMCCTEVLMWDFRAPAAEGSWLVCL